MSIRWDICYHCQLKSGSQKWLCSMLGKSMQKSKLCISDLVWCWMELRHEHESLYITYLLNFEIWAFPKDINHKINNLSCKAYITIEYLEPPYKWEKRLQVMVKEKPTVTGLWTFQRKVLVMFQSESLL